MLSQLDFCNSLYYGLPNKDLRSLQSIINSAARVIERMPRFSRERITPVIIELHFLPVKARIIFKICLLAFKALKYGYPAYLVDLLVPYNSQRSLRNDFEGRLQEPIIAASSYSNRCFSYCAPRLYNSLPLHVRLAPNVMQFKKLLKTELFLRSYDIETLSIRHEFDV